MLLFRFFRAARTTRAHRLSVTVVDANVLFDRVDEPREKSGDSGERGEQQQKGTKRKDVLSVSLSLGVCLLLEAERLEEALPSRSCFLESGSESDGGRREC